MLARRLPLLLCALLGSPLLAQKPLPAAPTPSRQALQPRSLAFGLKLWLRADAGLKFGLGNQVSIWRDQSPAGNDLVQGDGAHKPKLERIGPGGKAALRFDGNDFLSRPNGMPTGDYTKIAVVTLDDYGSPNNVLSGSAQHALFFGQTDRAMLFHQQTFVQSSVPTALGVPTVLVATFEADSGQGRLYQDGALVGSGTALPHSDPSLQLGAFAGGNSLLGRIAEVAVYDRVLTASEQSRIERRLFRQYVQPSAPDVVFSSLPSDGQILQRNPSGPLLHTIEGTVDSPGFSRVRARLFKDGVLAQQPVAPLAGGGAAPFSLPLEFTPGLFDYDLEVSLESQGVWVPVAVRENLACGDLFLVQGQSNAMAGDYWNEQLGNQSQSYWLRSFGSATLSEVDVAFDLDWDRAEGELFNEHASVGSWALRLGEILVDGYQVPIGLLNGGEGGSRMAEHQRNDANPEDPNTIYGRLLFRARRSGFDQARSLIYYQGESDGADPNGWFQGWQSLYDDWKQDFAGLEQLYLFQVRAGCGVGKFDRVREAQRVVPDFHADVGIMSSTAVPMHDGCHYFYPGYRELASRIARLIERDLYGATPVAGIDPPNIEAAFWNSAERDEIRLVFRDPADALVFDAGAVSSFCLDDGAEVVSGAAAGRRVVLQLARPSRATSVSYVGHPNDGAWLQNQLGVGALAFHDQPIQPFFETSGASGIPRPPGLRR